MNSSNLSASSYMPGFLQNKVNAFFACSIYLMLTFMSSFIGIANAAQAITTEELQSQGKLKIALSMAKSDKLIPNQQVIVDVNIFSTYPFNDNFDLPYFDLEDAVTIPPKAEASLDIEIIDEQQWFVQSKKVIIYPLKDGSFTVPSLSVKAFINVDNQAVVSGRLNTEAFTFNVVLPSALTGIDNFIASSEVGFTLKQSKPSDPASEENSKAAEQPSYNIGSAVTFTYTTKADNMHVIMLSKIKIPKIEGIQVYQKPSIEKDVFDRFEKFNTAILTEKFTFIFQQEGLFTIPSQRLIWWDTINGELKETLIDEHIFNVGKGAAVANNNGILTERAANALSFNKVHIMQWLAIVILAVFLIAVIRQVAKHRHALINSFHRINKTKQKALINTFNLQLKKQNYHGAINCLYALSMHSAGSVDPLSATIDKDSLIRLQALQQLAFAHSPNDTEASSNAASDKESNKRTEMISFSQQDGELLIASILKKQSRWKKFESFKFSSTLNPNP